MHRVPLREELQIQQSDVQQQGATTYVIYDPLQNRYFQVGWVEYEILQRWHYENTQDIINEVVQVTDLNVSEDMLQHCNDFLSINQLLQKTASERTKPRNPWLTRHLFWKIPLLKPNRWLAWLQPWCQIFYTKSFIVG